MDRETIHEESCELCVIGMGVAGLNALESSSQYLSKKDKIIVVDKRAETSAIGGMWNTTYPFVRLHQPHALFTVGNKKWSLKKDASYLADRNEILTHFKSCYQAIKNKRWVIEKFGYEYVSHTEVKTANGYEAHITFEPVNETLPLLVVKAKRCLKVFGYNVRPGKPLELSSKKVRSLSPENSELTSGEVANDDKPVYIIGGGKTSMDVASLILDQNPDRKINFIIGKGSYFFNRDVFFPPGTSKNWKGTPVNQAMLNIALEYDEENLNSKIESLKKDYCLAPFEKAKQTLHGILSPEEAARITKAMEPEIYEYLADVKERNEGLNLHYKSGKTAPIAEGSWLINCQGYVYRQQATPEPVLSRNKSVLSINETLPTLIFSSFAGYFLPHLWFRNQFEKVPIVYFNHPDLIRKEKSTFTFAIAAQIIYNLIGIIDALPIHVVYRCGLNFDKWFPLHRQIPVLIKILIKKRKLLKHTMGTLDHICTKYEVEKGIVGQ